MVNAAYPFFFPTCVRVLAHTTILIRPVAPGRRPFERVATRALFFRYIRSVENPIVASGLSLFISFFFFFRRCPCEYVFFVQRYTRNYYCYYCNIFIFFCATQFKVGNRHNNNNNNTVRLSKVRHSTMVSKEYDNRDLYDFIGPPLSLSLSPTHARTHTRRVTVFDVVEKHNNPSNTIIFREGGTRLVFRPEHLETHTIRRTGSSRGIPQAPVLKFLKFFPAKDRCAVRNTLLCRVLYR